MQTRQKLFKSIEPADDGLVPLHQRPEYAGPLEELQELERLHAQKERERKTLLARLHGQKTKRTAAELAQDLLAGGRVDPVSIPDRLAALNEELLILRQAITAKTRTLDEISGSLSYAESERLKPEFDRIMRTALSDMEKLHGTFAAAAQLANRLHRAGYRPSPILLSDLMPPAVAQLGDPSAIGVSQSWYFRKALEQRGII